MAIKHDHKQQSDRFRGDRTERTPADRKTGRNERADVPGEIRDERHSQREPQPEAESLAESLERTDKDIRAKRDLRRGNRA